MNSLQTNFRLIYVFFIFAVSLLVWNEYNFSQNTKNYADMHNNIEELQIELLQLRRAEKDFLLRKNEKFIDIFYKHSKKFEEKLASLEKNNNIFFMQSNTKENIKIYFDSFSKISNLILDIGITKECGLTSDLCKSSQQLEKNFASKNLYKESILHLKLRRAEKDFFLRSDIKYFELHKELFQELSSYALSDENRQLLNNYNNDFLEIAKKLRIIGLNENSALKWKMRDSIHHVETAIKEKVEIAHKHIHKNIKKLEIMQYIIYGTILLVFTFLYFFIINPVLNATVLFKRFFKDFSDASQRLDSSKLKFEELQNISLTINKMLDEREKFEDDLIKSRDKALHLQQVKEQFLSNMSHELRTPLNAIVGFSTILQKNIPEQNRLIDPIVQSSQHLLQIVNDILDISKIQSGKFSIIFKRFELKGELKNSLMQFESKALSKNIKFTKRLSFENEIYLYGDWLRIAQILNNFLSNALKFTPDGGEINFDVDYTDDILTISVKDNGIGMSEDVQKKILHPFEQADSSATKNYGGAGIGLSISDSLAKMMNGKIIIKSKEGEGSTFTLKLPVQKAHNTEESIDDFDIEKNKSFLAHILVAEDNKENQLLLRFILDDLNITYDIANDGEEAVEMYGKKAYDLVLMDENMPKMSGIEAMIEIRKRYTNVVPIIAVTANVMKGDEKRFLEVGMDDFIPKPIDHDELVDTLTKYLK